MDEGAVPQLSREDPGLRRMPLPAYLLTGDAANADPVCDLSPHHHLVTEAVSHAGQLRVEEKPLIFRDHRNSLAASQSP